MDREVIKLTGAAHWASYIINDNSSGLEPEEKALCDAWLERECGDRFLIVDCEEESRFTWSYDIHTGDDCRGGNVIDYTAIEVAP